MTEIPKFHFELARNVFRARIQVALNHAVLEYVRATDTPIADLAARMKWSEGQYWAALNGSVGLQLDAISDMALSIGHHVNWQTFKLEEIPFRQPNPEPSS